MINVREELLKIITYHSDEEGTSGYLLSNKQIDQLLSLIEKQNKEVINTPLVDDEDNEIDDHLSEAFLRTLQLTRSKESLK